MSLQSDQDTKRVKRAAAHAVQLSNVVLPASAVPVVNTDPPTPVVVQPNSYPTPPF